TNAMKSSMENPITNVFTSVPQRTDQIPPSRIVTRMIATLVTMLTCPSESPVRLTMARCRMSQETGPSEDFTLKTIPRAISAPPQTKLTIRENISYPQDIVEVYSCVDYDTMASYSITS